MEMEITETYESPVPVKETYEPPAFVEVGGFAEQTMGAGYVYPEGRPAMRYLGS
ncbi:MULTISPECIES: lasso RiPP family leader peptide-containing protein [Pseudonocardia]|jgi:hypothetical protein|uniref:Lasso RiPP family leader peptide-containing protein n=2 Tax=Pseudonocardia TaxID=1847 RepID=A0ABS9TJD4_9PSEU|nr:lasso RiPP family leader peptide-containing protein [Pseudonocardia alaniniphila]MCH6168654.1 lasso RiPP family leader peptide-containing protein [Pseudonocardia alaniniphila]